MLIFLKKERNHKPIQTKKPATFSMYGAVRLLRLVDTGASDLSPLIIIPTPENIHISPLGSPITQDRIGQSLCNCYPSFRTTYGTKLVIGAGM